VDVDDLAVLASETASNRAGTNVFAGDVASSGVASSGVLEHLRRLDTRLAQAVAVAPDLYGETAGGDPFRGLHVGPSDVDRMLRRQPGEPPFGLTPMPPCEAPAPRSPLAQLAVAYDLDGFDLDVLLIALAPEIDLRYERVYAYLQDDITRRRPTVDLVLNLLCHHAQERLARRAQFGPDAPLVRNRLIRLVPDPTQVDPPLLAHYVGVDEQIVDVLVGCTSLDRRLSSWCSLSLPDAEAAALAWGHDLVAEVTATIRHTSEPPTIHLRGPSTSGLAVASAVAATLDLPMLTVRLDRVPGDADQLTDALRLLWREADLFGAIVCLMEPDGLDRGRADRLQDELSGVTSPVIVAGPEPWASRARSRGIVTVEFGPPSPAERLACWRAALTTATTTPDPSELAILAERYVLTAAQIEDAANSTRRSPGPVSLARLAAAARAQTGPDLARLANPVPSVATWDDIVLPADALAQLREVCARVAAGGRVLRDWGFDRKLGRGTGAAVLFAGPTGTGKTMAAEILTNALGLGLYKIDLAGVISKYIGETEKNLDRIFTAAADANAILFFDEAEALFGKRSEVRDAHDRYANIEVAYLLQKMEAHDGLTILATNLRGNLDEAFTRRLAFTIHFPFPDEEHRRRIWAGIWPSATPLGDDIDVDLLARRFSLSGGNIKNVALAAAFLAADAGTPVSMAHVLHAVRREYQKLGKDLSDEGGLR